MVLAYWSRFLGGLLAGLVINVIEALANGVLFANAWAEAMRALNRPDHFTTPQIVAFNVWGFLMGIGAIWIYSQIRLRYGPGVRTALCAGLAVWAIGYAFGAIPSVAMGLFPGWLIAYGVLIGLLEICLATVLGAWVYKPPEVARPTPAS